MSARDELAASFRRAIFGMMKRHPVSEHPEEGTYTCVDDGCARYYGAKRMPARFKGGRWVHPGGGDLPFEPTHWLSFKGGAS